MRFETRLQSHWDLRAACNFMFGGTGSGLLLFSVIAAYPAAPGRPVLLLSLLLVGLGLFCVWLEIGRPWRFINVFFHPHTSWMSREATVAVMTFLFTAAGTLAQIPLLIQCGALCGVLFLYCQGKILQASKGIPVWREPAILHLIMATGFVEGWALVCGVLALAGTATSVHAAILAALLVARAAIWRIYESRLLRQWTPDALVVNLSKNRRNLVHVGTLIPLLLLAIVFFVPGSGGGAGSRVWPGLALLLACAGALAAGWYTKWNLITRASHVQGYAISTRVQKGRPKLHPPVVRGGYR